MGKWPLGPSRPRSAFPAWIIHSANPKGCPRPPPAQDFKAPPVFPPDSLPAWGSVRPSPPTLHAGLLCGEQRGQE